MVAVRPIAAVAPAAASRRTILADVMRSCECGCAGLTSQSWHQAYPAFTLNSAMSLIHRCPSVTLALADGCNRPKAGLKPAQRRTKSGPTIQIDPRPSQYGQEWKLTKVCFECFENSQNCV